MIAQVTTLTTAVGTIIIPGAACKTIIIQNNGSVNVRLSFDGGSTYTDHITGKKGTDPTVSTGYKLVNGSQVSIATAYGDSGLHKPIRAITETGTATLDIVTDEYGSVFPTA